MALGSACILASFDEQLVQFFRSQGDAVVIGKSFEKVVFLDESVAEVIDGAYGVLLDNAVSCFAPDTGFHSRISTFRAAPDNGNDATMSFRKAATLSRDGHANKHPGRDVPSV